MSFLSPLIIPTKLPFISLTHQAPPATKVGGKAKKKKWSKGKVKDKANNAIVLEKAIYDKIYKEVPTYKLVTVAVLVDRLKVNGSLARVILRALEKEGHLKLVSKHGSQLIYTRATAAVE